MKTTQIIDSPFNIAAVERDTGIAKDTLRVWERRYGFPNPGRDAHGERLYPPDQVEKLRLIRRLLDQGKRPAKIVTAAIADLVALTEPPAPGASELAHDDALLKCVRLHRSSELAAGLRQALLKQGLQGFVINTIAPLNLAIGEAWMRGEIDVPDEHLYTEQVQNILRGAIVNHMPETLRPRILLTTFPDEHHILGLLMVEAIFSAEGVSCLSLGTRTPIADIQKAAVQGKFDVIGLSFSSAYPARQAIDALSELRELVPGNIEIWAGGAAMMDKRKRLRGIRVIPSLTEALNALAEWRVTHAG